jgi:GTPase SAR1 family protein
MVKKNKNPEPYEVFSPGAPPLGVHNVYVSRGNAEKSLKRYVQRHQVPVVWGEYGVGKTSLVRKYFRPLEDEGRLVYIASVAGLSLPDIFRAILEQLEYTVEVSSSVSSTIGVDGGFDLKVVKATAQGSNTEVRSTQLVVSSPTDVSMINLVRERRLTVVLDEMHKATGNLRAALADWIKATRANPGEFNLVLVGTSTDAGRLVALDYGIDRYVKEMAIDIMTDDEARFIVDEGFDRLDLNIPEVLREKLIRSAAGAPTIIHALCLDTAESAIDDSRNIINEEDVKFAVSEHLRENTGRLFDHYQKAIETTGKLRYRKQVLRAVALTGNDYATMDDIRSTVSVSLGQEVPASSLSGPLRELKKPEYGSILKDVDRDVSGARIRNLTAFTDPMMKSFVRFMNNLDDTGLMPNSPNQIIDGDENQDEEM